MRILIVAMAESIHTVRWLSQISDQGWLVHLFPSLDYGTTHPDLQSVTVYHSFYDIRQNRNKNVTLRGVPVFNREMTILGRGFLEKFIPNYRTKQLKRVIRKVNPDIIHSLEIQHAGYLTLEARKTLHGPFPPWIVTNWGSDIYLFGRLSKHRPKIREVLAACDYYSCECQRDVCLAKDFGFNGEVLPVFPNAGGFDLQYLSRLRFKGKASLRRLIMLKGYQHWAGRALVGLRALERCSDLLGGYQVAVYSAHPEVEIAAELFSDSTGVPVTIVPDDTPNHEILKLHGQARISIGLSIGDAISTSLLEAIVMGSFPIQSLTSCAGEWIENGKNGIIVPPEDPEIVEGAIRQALTNDELVNRAEEINYSLAKEKLDETILKPNAVGIYNTVAKERGFIRKP
jgi:hypothetical protein